MYESCIEKQNLIMHQFQECDTEEKKYKRIIELGRHLPAMNPKYRTSSNLVKGCQSNVYLHSDLSDDKVYFEGESDALISAGLLALLLEVYNRESPEAILKCPPDFLEGLGISASLTPSRANGLYSIHLRMKQEALKLLIRQKSNLDP